MNCKQNRIAVLLVLALLLSLLAGCGGKSQEEAPPPDPLPSEDTQPAPPADEGDAQPEAEEPPEAPETDAQPEPAPPADAPEEPAPPSKPEETPPKASETAPKSQAAPSPEPAPQPEPTPEPEGETVRAGDTYTISVTLEGGSGRATVESPAKLYYDETGKCWATIVWSSPNFDYMKVDGQRYDPINTEGNSTFEILISTLDQPLAVIADTIAMSEPHEVEYTLTFDFASMQDA